jgi:hypothetical protein
MTRLLTGDLGQTNIEKFPIKRKTKRITLSNNEEVVIPQNVRVKRWVGHFDTLYVVIVAWKDVATSLSDCNGQHGFISGFWCSGVLKRKTLGSLGAWSSLSSIDSIS